MTSTQPSLCLGALKTLGSQLHIVNQRPASSPFPQQHRHSRILGPFLARGASEKHAHAMLAELIILIMSVTIGEEDIFHADRVRNEIKALGDVIHER